MSPRANFTLWIHNSLWFWLIILTFTNGDEVTRFPLQRAGPKLNGGPQAKSTKQIVSCCYDSTVVLCSKVSLTYSLPAQLTPRLWQTLHNYGSFKFKEHFCVICRMHSDEVTFICGNARLLTVIWDQWNKVNLFQCHSYTELAHVSCTDTRFSCLIIAMLLRKLNLSTFPSDI